MATDVQPVQSQPFTPRQQTCEFRPRSPETARLAACMPALKCLAFGNDRQGSGRIPPYHGTCRNRDGRSRTGGMVGDSCEEYRAVGRKYLDEIAAMLRMQGSFGARRNYSREIVETIEGNAYRDYRSVLRNCAPSGMWPEGLRDFENARLEWV